VLNSTEQPRVSVQVARSLPPQSALQLALWARLRLVTATLCALLIVQLLGGDVLSSGYHAFGEALSPHGLVATRDEARALRAQRRGSSAQLIIFRAAERGPQGASLGDVWAAEAVVSPEGRVATLERVHNLTRTSSADESTPVLLGHHALFARSIEGKTVGLELLDLSGEPPPHQGVLARARRGVTNPSRPVNGPG
jgi:hypothetical protein